MSGDLFMMRLWKYVDAKKLDLTDVKFGQEKYMVKHLEKNDDFNALISKDKILVDFYADWCGPCKMLAPILEELKTIDVLKVNVDEFEELAARYGIMSIPSLLLFKDGKLISQEVGFKNLDDLEKMINNN